jgi:hypothetical protein
MRSELVSERHLSRRAIIYIRHNAAEKVMAEQRMVMQ